MVLTDLAKGEKAVIKKINANGELRHRFNSFGLHRGTDVYVDEYTISKATFKIIAGNTLIALRANEAKMIEIVKHA
jgi:ferrous iron transport protein A